MSTAWRSSTSVEVRQEPGTLILRLCGELDMASRDLIEPAVMAAIPSAYAVVLDLRDLTFCDSTGVAMFVAANEKAKAAGTTLTVANLQPSVSRVFEIMGMQTVLNICQ